MRKIRGLLVTLLSVCLISVLYNPVIRAEGEVAKLVSGNTETLYASIYDAVDSAADGDTVTLLEDVTLTTTLTIDKAITFDINGHTITGSSNTVVNITTSGVTVSGEGTINGSNSGCVVAVSPTSADPVILDSIDVYSSGNRAIQVSSALSSGRASVYVRNCNTVGIINGIYVSGTNCDIYLSGGTHIGNTAGKVLEVAAGDATGDEICKFIMSGDTRLGLRGQSGYPVQGMDAQTCPFEGYHYVTEILGQDRNWLITNDPQYQDNSTVVTYEATVENGHVEWYATIEEAIEAAGENETVVLQANIVDKTLTITKKVTIDMHGHTITASADSDCIPFVTDSNNADLTITNTASSGNAKIVGSHTSIYAKRGTITLQIYNVKCFLETAAQEATDSAIRVIDGTVTIGGDKSVNCRYCGTFFTIEGSGRVNLNNSNLTINVKGTAMVIGDGEVVFGPTSSVSYSNTYVSTTSPAITVGNGTLSVTTLRIPDKYPVGLLITGSASVTWSSGTINGTENGIVCTGAGAEVVIGADVKGTSGYGILLSGAASASSQADIVINSNNVEGSSAAIRNEGFTASSITLTRGTYKCAQQSGCVPFDEAEVTIIDDCSVAQQGTYTWVIVGAVRVGHSLTLEGDIGLNYYYELPADADGDTLSATVSVNGGEAVAATIQTLNPPRTEGGHTYTHRVKISVAPKDYDDEITVNLYSSGQLLRSSNTYSVKDYCHNTTGSGALGNLISATETYCACAAAYFDGAEWPSGVPSTTTVDEDLLVFNFDDVATTNEMMANRGIQVQLYGSSLVLETQTELRLYFRITDPDVDVSEIFVKVDNQTTHLVRVEGTNYCYISISNIHASKLDTKHLIKIGGTHGELAIYFSVMDYIDQNLNGNDTDLKKLLVALYNYYTASYAYFPHDGN